MRSRIGALMIALSLMYAGPVALAQPAAQSPTQAASQAPNSAKSSPEPVAADPTKPPANPTSLAGEADTLYELAAELKVQVDRTNKNILSMTVVRKAQAIEQLAHQMKLQAKK